MRNITLALDEKIIKAGREYARRHKLTLNSLIRKLLEEKVARDPSNWLEEHFALVDKIKVPANAAKKWKREDLYRV